jgi:hypothetical protein
VRACPAAQPAQPAIRSLEPHFSIQDSHRGPFFNSANKPRPRPAAAPATIDVSLFVLRLRPGRVIIVALLAYDQGFCCTCPLPLASPPPIAGLGPSSPGPRPLHTTPALDSTILFCALQTPRCTFGQSRRSAISSLRSRAGTHGIAFCRDRAHQPPTFKALLGLPAKLPS